MTSKRQSLGDRPQRVSKAKTGGFTLNMEYLEDRYAPVSDIIPGTDLAGPDFTGNVPPQPEGAVGTDYLVSVVNNNIQWRLKDGSDTPVEVSINDLFNNNPATITGQPIVDSSGNVLEFFDNTPIGINFGNATNQPFTVQALAVGGDGGYTAPTVDTGPAAGTAGFGASGARVQYDQYLGRFVVKAEGNNNDNSSYIWVAVSVSENPNDGFHLLSLFTFSSYDPDGRGVGQGFLDSTVRDVQFGMTRDALIFTGNVHLEQSSVAFDSRIFIVDKQFYFEGNGTTGIRFAPTLTDWYDGGSGSHHTNMIPTHNYDADENTAFILEPAPRELFNPITGDGIPIIPIPNQAHVFRIDNAPFFSELVRNDPQLVTGLSAGFGFPTEALARGDVTGPVQISVNDQGSRIPGGAIFTSAVYRPDQSNPFGGVGSIWTAHTLNRDTDGDGIPDRPTVRWYEFTARTPRADQNFTIPVTRRQEGGVNADAADSIFDPNNNFILDTWAPAIVVNSLNDMGISFAGSNEVTYISAFYAGRFEADVALNQFVGTTRPAKVLRYGEAFYNRQAPFGLPPWGPFSGIGLDPLDDDRFWAFNAYASEPSGLFGRWSTTWGAFELVPDTLIFAVDVSLSMEYIHSIDVNGDGVVDSQDDRNGDGLDGSVLDQAIYEIELLAARGILPSQDGRPGNVALIIFGRDASPVEIDLLGTGGTTILGSPDADYNGNQIPDFLEAVRSIDTGEAGVISLSAVDPTRTFYNSALAAIGTVAGLSGAGVTQVQMLSNGAGRLPDPANPPIPPNVRIDTIVLGPYQLVGDTTQYTSIARATLSRVIRINNPSGVLSAPAPVGLSAGPRVMAPGEYIIADDSIAGNDDDQGSDVGDPPVDDPIPNQDPDEVIDDLVDDLDTDIDQSPNNSSGGEPDDDEDLVNIDIDLIDEVFEDELV